MGLVETGLHQKGWGHEVWIVNNPSYCGKILVVKKGKRCSLHFHKEKTETMFVNKGQIEMTYGSLDSTVRSKVVLLVGDAFHIPPLMVHQFLALEDSEIIEVSTQHFEQDSFRLEKGD